MPRVWISTCVLLPKGSLTFLNLTIYPGQRAAESVIFFNLLHESMFYCHILQIIYGPSSSFMFSHLSLGINESISYAGCVTNTVLFSSPASSMNMAKTLLKLIS